MKLVNLAVNRQDVPLDLLIVLEIAKPNFTVQLNWGTETSFKTDEVSFTDAATACRWISIKCRDLKLNGTDIETSTVIDHWLTFSATTLRNDLLGALARLNKALIISDFLVGTHLTIADIIIWAKLHCAAEWQTILTEQSDRFAGVSRWYGFVRAKPEVKQVLGMIPADIQTGLIRAKSVEKKSVQPTTVSGRKQEGKFVELVGAEMGKVVVRFPPEASGYLHIGHAKAALLNQHYQESFEGKLIMRFDDTNPAKENAEFEKVILEDLKMLQVQWDMFSHTSDHFDLILSYCEKLIRDGNAYCDDTEPELMKQQREQKIESKNRQNSPEKNLSIWEEMKLGSQTGLKFCVRAKIDMQSVNGCMRDPTMYRCKLESHIRTGDKYKVYPTYDFACPIVDSVEGVTHALRTTEYHDRDEQYNWFLEIMQLRKPVVWAYSRLCMTHTVLSKRKLAWFVNEGIVDGWNDPRFPTVRGILRRGMTVEGLKQFIISQGSSRSVVTMEWDKIWAINKKVIDPIAPRYTALVHNTVPVQIKGAVEEVMDAAKHPKNPDIGNKRVWMSPEVFIEQEDVSLLKEGEMATFINWGNMLVAKINRGSDGVVTSIECDPKLDNKDYKKTPKITWLSTKAPLIPVVTVYFDHLLRKAVLDKDDDFKNFVNDRSRVELPMRGDPDLLSLAKGDIIEIQRKGFFICDSPYEPRSPYVGLESPLILFYIPDGRSKLPPVVETLLKSTASPKEVVQTLRGKSAEKSPLEEVVSLPAQPAQAGPVAVELNAKIASQGEKVRQLKSAKAEKSAIDVEVKALLALKAEYKAVTGQEWKPGTAPVSALPQQKKDMPLKKSGAELLQSIQQQGEKVKQMKASNASKNDIGAEVKILLALKEEFKELSGQEWKPGMSLPAQTEPVPAAASSNAGAADLNNKINEQGAKIRQMKGSNADKDSIKSEVNLLLTLKAEYKTLTGNDWQPDQSSSSQASSKKQPRADSSGKGKKDTENKQKAKAKSPSTTAAEAPVDQGTKKTTRLGMEATKEENFSDWYSQIITKSEMIEYYDVSGCYILRPWAFSIWDAIKDFFDAEIKKLGVQNCYFPVFVSHQALEKEKTHIADFAPEVAWVTKSGSSDLAEPIAIRPTSETVMYPAYAKWIKSHRDLPLRLNQWCNVVRWEFKHPIPFLRAREFLWQEGHSAFANETDAVEEVYQILDLYRRVYEELLAIPVIRGRKTEKEKFAGGDFTTTVEAYIGATGRGVQGGTSHHLGQNFSKMFEIVYEDPDVPGEKRFAYQNSWGLTTRTIGVMVMVHADDTGLVLPPRVACIQVVIVPCGVTVSLPESDRKALLNKCEALEKQLKDADVRVKGDYRDNYSPGWKFNHWELKGVPIRIELGPRDVKKGEYVAVRRDTGEKVTLSFSNAVADVKGMLDSIQKSMFNKAKAEIDKHVITTHSWDEFCTKLDSKCLLIAPFCGGIECEEQIKKDSAREDAGSDAAAPSMGAKSLCIPFDQPTTNVEDLSCINPQCSSKSKFFTLFGRSY